MYSLCMWVVFFFTEDQYNNSRTSSTPKELYEMPHIRIFHIHSLLDNHWYYLWPWVSCNQQSLYRVKIFIKTDKKKTINLVIFCSKSGDYLYVCRRLCVIKCLYMCSCSGVRMYERLSMYRHAFSNIYCKFGPDFNSPV